MTLLPTTVLVVGNTLPPLSDYYTDIHDADQRFDYRVVADDYVESGDWVFHCGTDRLISRMRLAPPRATLAQPHQLQALLQQQPDTQREMLSRLTAGPEWPGLLKYSHSHLNKQSRLDYHSFQGLVTQEGTLWVVELRQEVLSNRHHLTMEPYDRGRWRDYHVELYEAERSCTKSQ